MLWINEIFGPTVQGEGVAAGRHCLFVRVANCNLHCQWCDTAHTWAFDERKASMLEKPKVFDKAKNRIQMTEQQVMDRLLELWPDPAMVVISGGEPLMQSIELAPLVQSLYLRGYEVHIETAATIRPHDLLDRYVTRYNVSPKLAHSGNRLAIRRKPDVLEWFGADHKSWFKFVMRSASDFEEVDELVKIGNISPSRVMVMPEGTTAEKTIETAKLIRDGAIRRGYGISFRTHILLWGDERGV